MVEQWPSKPEVKGSSPFGADTTIPIVYMINWLFADKKNSSFGLLLLIDLKLCTLKITNMSELFSLVIEKNCVWFYSKGWKNFKKFKDPKININKDNKNSNIKDNKDKKINNFKSFNKFSQNKQKFSKFNKFNWKFNKKKNYFWKFKSWNWFFEKFNFKQSFSKPKRQFINKLYILQGSPTTFTSFFFSPFWLKFKAKQVALFKNSLFFKNRYSHFLIRALLNKKIGLKNSWKSLLLTISDLKMWAMLEHYDYFGLYSTSWNYISVHSELNPKKSLFWLLPTFVKDQFVNVFFRRLYKKKIFKLKKYKFIKRFMWLWLKPQYLLEWKMLRKLYLPLFGKWFEKTDPIQRSFFLPQYEIFRKLLPHATWDFLGYMSWTTRYERYLYSYPYHYSALFFRNFIWYISNWKRTRFLNFWKYKVKFHHWNVLFSLINMMMYKVSINWFTKRTDAHFAFPFRYVKIFLKKIFENKQNWLVSSFFKTKSFFRNKLLNNNKYKEVAKRMRLVFALNWSSGKRFYWKVLEHETFSKLDYFKTAKYVRWDLVVDSFPATMWKDFPWYAEKFRYDTMNFNYKWLLRVLFPHQKLIEYNLLKSNNLYNYLKVNNINRKFFSLLKIFWSDWRPRRTQLSDYNLLYPVNFDFKQYEIDENQKSFLHDIEVSQIFYTHPYEYPYTYYKQIFFASKKTWGLEFFFSKNLVLAASIIWFPILLSSRYYVEWFYVLVINKADYKELSGLRDIVRDFPKFENNNWVILYKRYLDQFLSFKKTYLFLNLLLKTSILDRNIYYKNTVLKKILLWFNFKKISIFSKYFFFIHILQFFNYLKFKFSSTIWFSSFLIKMIFWQFFSLVNFTKTLFKPNNIVIKPYFTQSLWTIKWNPITQFWFIGTWKTSSTGILTAFAYSFNIFAAPVYYNLTINRNNPNYFSQNIKKDQIFFIPSWIVINDLVYEDLRQKLSTTIFDGLYEFLVFSNYLVKNTKLLSNEFICKFKISLLSIYPFNILKRDCFLFWYHYILDFDNQSINFLTSKMRWNTWMNSYFIGPITITLFNTNKKLLDTVSTTEYKYLSTLLVLSSLEVQALVFPDLIFPFQFDYKKFTLGWKHRLLKVFYEDNFFFFFKDNFFTKFYSNPNYLELQVLTAFTTSLFLNLTRYMNINKYSYSHFDKEARELWLFPDVIFWDKFYDKYKFRWLFFGFTESFWINWGLISNYNSFLLIMLYLSWIFVNTALRYRLNVLQTIMNFTDFITNDAQLDYLDFIFPVVRYNDRQFMWRKFLNAKLSMHTSLLPDFYLYKNFLTKFAISHFYYFLDENKQNNSFNNQLIFSLPRNISFLTKVFDNHYDLFLKKIFIKIRTFSLKHFNFIYFNRYWVISNLKKYLIFKVDFKLDKTEPYLSKFSLVWLKQFQTHMLIIYNSKWNFIFNTLFIFLKKKILKLLFLIKLVFLFTKFNKWNLKIILYFYYLLIYLLKLFINKFKFTSKAKYMDYFTYLNFSEILFQKNMSLRVFAPNNGFYNKIFKSIFILRRNLGTWELFIYNFSFWELVYSFFTKSLSIFSYFVYNFFFIKVKNNQNFFTLKEFSGVSTNFIFSNLFYSSTFLVEYFKKFFFLINNQKKLTRYNFFFQPTRSGLASFFFDDESSHNYSELLKKMSLQILLNSQTLILKNQNFFWFLFLKHWKHFNLSFDFAMQSFIADKNKLEFIILKKKKIYRKKKVTKNLLVYNAKFWTKWFKTVVYIKRLIALFWWVSKKNKRLRVFWKLMELFASNKLIQTYSEIKFLKTDTPKHWKSAKAIINFKLKLNKKINDESLYFFWDKIIKILVAKFLFKLLKRWNLWIKFLDFTSLDIFYLQIFSRNSYFLRDSLGFWFNKFFITSFFSIFAKFLYLFVWGQNYFYNIIPILKLWRLHLLFTMLKKFSLLNDHKFMISLKNYWKLSPITFNTWAEILKLIVLAFWLTFFIELINYKELFSMLFAQFSNFFSLLINKFLTKFKLNMKMFSQSFLLGICFSGLQSIQKTLAIEAKQKNLFRYKNAWISIFSRNSFIDVYKSANLGFFWSLLYSLDYFNDSYFTDLIFFSRLSMQPNFILFKPAVIGARLQNFELISWTVADFNLSYAIKHLLLSNIWYPVTIQFLISLFFYFYIRSCIIFFCD